MNLQISCIYFLPEYKEDIELKVDDDPPILYIDSISHEGLVVIKFDREIRLLEEEEQKYYTDPFRRLQEDYTESMLRRLNQGQEDNFENYFFGHRLTNASMLAYLNNGTVAYGGKTRPVLELYIKQGGYDPTKLDFNWTAVEFTSLELKIQIDFESPVFVSYQDEQDILIVKIYG